MGTTVSEGLRDGRSTTRCSLQLTGRILTPPSIFSPVAPSEIWKNPDDLTEWFRGEAGYFLEYEFFTGNV